MIKALVFDCGGVFLDLDLERAERNFRERTGFEEIDKYLDTKHLKDYFNDFEEGLLSEEEFISRTKSFCKEGTSTAEICECLQSMIVGMDPEKTKVISEFKGKYELYLLSNHNPIALRRTTRIFEDAGIPLDKSFRKCYISFKLKTIKPKAEFFEKVIEDIGLDPKEMLFIDDSQRNVDAAQGVGMNAVLYVCGTNLLDTVKAELARLG